MTAVPRKIDPNKIKIADVILVASGTKVTIDVQHMMGYGDRSKWTHVAGSLGGCDLIEGQVPRSRVCDLQKDYVDKNIEIKVMRKKSHDNNYDRIKIALWWATMNNTLYDFPQLIWYPIKAIGHVCPLIGNLLLNVNNKFGNKKLLICSELLASGFYKQNHYIFGKSAEDVLPADFDDNAIFTEVTDIWL
jgi:hypothetical protein